MSRPASLVGRDAELDIVVEHLRRTPGGPSALVVEGPEGVGKSVLVTEAVRRVHGEGFDDVRKAVGHPGERCARVLLGHLGVHIDDPHQGGRVPAGEDIDALATQAAEAWGSPRVLLVEEAHLVPPNVLAVIHAAALATPSRPVLVLVARPEPRIDIRDAHRLRLTGLPLSAVVDLVRSRHDLPGDAVARVIHALTGGLPGDILDLLSETPPEVWAERQPVLTATRRHRRRVSAIRDTVDPDSWRLLQAVAISDGPAELAGAAALAGVSVDAVDPLVDLGVVTTPAGRGVTRVLLDHPMTALAVRDVSGPRAVRDLHRLAAERSDDEGRRLRHLVGATVGTDPDLAAHLAAHAQDCGEAGQWGQAARAYVDAAQVAGGDCERAAHLVEAVDAYVGAGEVPRAGDLVPELESHPRTARIDASLGYLSILRGRSRDAQVHLTRAWSRVDGEQKTPGGGDLPALVCTRWVLHSLVAGDGHALVDWADRALEHGGPSSVYAKEAAAIRGLGLAALGRDDEAASAFDLAYSLVGSTAQTQRVTMGRGWLDLMVDDPLAARSALESAASTDFSLGSTRIALWAQGWLARTLFVLGRWSDSLEVTRRAAPAVESSGHEIIRPLVHWPAAVIHAYRGDLDAARHHLAAGSAADHEYVGMWLPASVARAQVAESQADYAAVIRALDPVAASPIGDPENDPGFWPWRDIYGSALVLTGRLDEAERVLGGGLAAAERRGRRGEIARIEIMRGRLFGARGDIDQALESFDRAATRLSGLPMPVENARLHFVRGQVLRRAGRRREADEVMRAARDAFGRLGATTYLTRCDRELKASGVERLRSSGVDELTPQEAAVVDLVASGKTNKEVAGELYISVKTVQYHLTRVYAKLGLRSRSELAAHVAAAQHPGDAPTPDPPAEGAS